MTFDPQSCYSWERQSAGEDLGKEIIIESVVVGFTLGCLDFLNHLEVIGVDSCSGQFLDVG